MVPQLTGFYINLDRSPERAAFMQAQFGRLGMGWVQRHQAVDGVQLSVPAGCTLSTGEYACFLSHLQVLERSPADAFLLVLEDDTELSDQLPDLLDQAVQGPLGAQDLAFLECQPHFTLSHVAMLWEAACRHLVTDAAGRRTTGVELLNARIFYKWGCPAYVVSPAGRQKLAALYRQWLQEGPLLPIDRYFERALVNQELRGVVTIPFLATTGLQWHGRSTIGNGARTPNDFLMVLRRVLFGGELGDAAVLARAFAAPPVDPALGMLGLVLQQIAAVHREEAVRNRDKPFGSHQA